MKYIESDFQMVSSDSLVNSGSLHVLDSSNSEIFTDMNTPINSCDAKFLVIARRREVALWNENHHTQPNSRPKT